MAFDEVDHEVARAERDASPERFPGHMPDEIERVITASSASSSSSGVDVARRRASVATGISRIETQRDLERHPTELGRIHTQRSQHVGTVGQSLRTRTRDSKRPLPAFGAGKPFPPALPDREEYVVEFEGPDDPLHGQNWPLRKKILTAAMLGYTTMIAAFASSVFSTATRIIAAEYGVSTEVGILGVSLYVLGFATGPLFWAPLSELRGRRLPIWLSMFGFTLFSFATATAKDLQTILITRFFAGFCAASPLAVVGACFSDMFSNATRGIAITLYSLGVFTGPLLAPFIGGFIVTSYLGWRWTEYIPAIMGSSAFLLNFFFLAETYPPVILVGKAAELRRRTLNWGIHAKQEEIEVDFQELISKNFTRPMRLLFGEPLVLLISIYMAFIYGLLYLFLTAYPLVFQGIHGFSPGLSGLTFVGMITGEIIAGVVVLLQQPWYQRKLAANNGIPIPEWRLPSVIAGGVAFAGGLFWFGWSGYRADIHWIVPALSGLLSGFGLMSIFLQALNYLVDSYLMFAASAIAGNTFLRSLAGAGFPLFATYMFNGLGIEWAMTLLGCVAVLLIPIPIAFYKWGHLLRARSKFAPTPPPAAAFSSGDDEDDAAAIADGEKIATPNSAAGSIRRKDAAADGNGV